MHPTADHLQRTLLGKVEEPACQRGDANIDIAGNRGSGDRLRRLEEADAKI